MGANMFPAHVDEYFEKEVRLGATMGPLKIPPFIGRMGISPISTRPKKGSQARRIILDLSFPISESVNDRIDKDYYCGKPVKLTYPTVDTLAKRIAELHMENQRLGLNKKILLWKRNLARYFRQIPPCPRDYSLIGMRWRELIYFDCMMPMGLRSATFVAQLISSAITHIHNREFWSTNYLDDFGSAEYEDRAWNSFITMSTILQEIGATEAKEKAVEPTTALKFLSTKFDTLNMTISVAPERLTELVQELNRWSNRRTATRKQLQSLIGKLSFVTTCVRPGRIFLSRLIEAMKEMPAHGHTTLRKDLKQDINWWRHFMQKYDGISILWLQDCLQINKFLESDACLIAGGAHCDKEYIHFKFPAEVMEQTNHISQREMYTILIAIKKWCRNLAGKVVRLSSDNLVSVQAINSGRTHDHGP